MADTLIRTMGLFWRADRVFWGTPKNAGSLLGRPALKKRSAMVNFRDQTGIYVLYADYRIIYVGQAGAGNQKLFIRLRQHRRDDLAERWNQFSWFGVRWVKGNGELSMDKEAFNPSLATALNHVEGVLIHSAEPPLNGQGGRFGDNVTRYLQVRDERVGATDQELLRRLCEKMDVPTADREEQDDDDDSG